VIDLSLSASEMAHVVREVAVGIREHSEELRELDATVGDGDLGVTIELAAQAMRDWLNGGDATSVGEILVGVGLQINKVSPSTFGTLLACGFVSAGQAAAAMDKVHAKDLLVMANEAIAGIEKRGKAVVGDKTLLDALVPAVLAFGKGIGVGSEVSQALDAGVSAARSGMYATEQMKARFGRASRRPDGALGIQDAGATAMYYIIDCFARELHKYAQERM